MPPPARFSRLLLTLCLGLGVAQDARAGERLIDVGGHGLRLECIGAGQPTIVLDAGLGGTAGDWSEVQRQLAHDYQVCVYDRAGYGGSEPGPLPRTSSRLAAELRTLLERAAVAPPYVLGGHSFGGLNMRAFAGLFGADVAGLLLVDPPHERQVGGVMEGALLSRLDPNGLLEGLWQAGDFTAVLDALEPFFSVLGLDAQTVRAVARELEAYPRSAEEARAMVIPPSLPLMVIAHGRRVLPPGTFGDQLEAEWLSLQRALACEHAAGRYWVAETSGHMVMAEQPALVIRALRELAQGIPAATLAAERARACGA